MWQFWIVFENDTKMPGKVTDWQSLKYDRHARRTAHQNIFPIYTSWAKLRSLKISSLLFFFLFFEGALLKSSWQSECFTIHKWWWFFSRKFIRFPDFFRIYPDFHQIYVSLHTMDGLFLSYMIWWFSFPEIYPVSAFFRIFPRIFLDLH